MNIMSFGGGVQTVAMALMCVNGDLPMPDSAIFSDPGWEVEATYEYLSWFIPYCENKGMKFHVVSNGNIRADALNTERRWATMPLFTLDEKGKKGMLMRQCTNDYKITPVYKKVRKLLGLKPYQRTKNPANVWLGISTDEASRMKPSRVKYATNYYPLIENNISRAKCLEYIEDCGFPLPPKSACIGCPYHSDMFWQNLKNNMPLEFADACEFDRLVRFNPRKKMKCPMYLHRSCKPLSEVDFTQGQQDMFENECEGYCGL
jgi:hypothetical protein